MAFVEPPKGRARILDRGDEVRIEIPLRARGWGEYLLLLFLVGWLMGWSFGEVFVGAKVLRLIGSLFQSPPNAGNASSEPMSALLFMIGWLLAWTAGGAVVWYALLLMLIGREVIVVSPSSLEILIRPIGRLHRYRLSEVSNLRVIGGESEQSITEVIAFDYGASTVRFGIRIDPPEARQIVTLLKERFGQYMKEG